MTTQPTVLTYLEKMNLLEDTACIIDVITLDDGRTAVLLDKTIFYPQGGGQPFDQGTVQSDNAKFDVIDVRFKDGIVYHIGSFISGSFEKNEQVQLSINPERRALHNKLHTAGHMVDLAMQAVGMKLKPGRGYHFPDGAYVEYQGTLEEAERAALVDKLNEKTAEFAHAQHPVAVELVSTDELKKIAHFIPESMPKDKPTRAMIVDSFPAIPCGGTHVLNTKKIEGMQIQKIKNKKGNLRISYSVK